MRINFQLDAKKIYHRKNKGIKEENWIAAKSYEYYMVLISSNMNQVKERYKKKLIIFQQTFKTQTCMVIRSTLSLCKCL